ncbi:MAG: sialidase family protein [Dysgonamonadaceae bacterium]|nr:sialidase family protein [Dysgonamonadaceae bacterium]
MHRIIDNSLLILYENGKGNIVSKRSIDEGVSWSEAKIIYKSYVYENQGKSTKINIANPEFIQLSNGDIVAGFNLRPATNGIHPFSIAVKRSTDNGCTWGIEQVIYEAHPRFNDGCWEPSFLTLPDGTLHLYFANEYPYTESDEQEISMLSSIDNGVSWTKEAKTVSFRENHRDGMPVAILDEDNIVIAIEDNVSGQFQPYIISGSINDNWTTCISGASQKRYNALSTPLSENVYAGAPYLIKTDIGVYLLSYQTTKNRTNNWAKSTMEVVISETANNFKNPSQPFNVPLNKEAKWNSLTDLGKGEIAALSSTNFQSEKVGVWIIKGQIIKK